MFFYDVEWREAPGGVAAPRGFLVRGAKRPFRTGGRTSDLQSEDPCDQLGAIFDAELRVDIMQVVFHCLFGYVYCQCYLAVRQTFHDARQDFLLPRGKL